MLLMMLRTAASVICRDWLHEFVFFNKSSLIKTRFSTVLGNGADAYHDIHVHLDLIERSHQYRICQWDVLDVTETAALAAKKLAMAAVSNPAIVPLPRPRPVVLSDRPRGRSIRLREAARHPLFNLFAPLLKGIH